MSDANIMKNSNTKVKRRLIYQTLTIEEQKRLRELTIGHGNMATCEDATGKDRGMIMRAMVGGRLLPDNAKRIREFITARS